MLYEDLLSRVGPDYWVVTVNERLARFLWQAKLEPEQVLPRHTLQSWQSFSKSLWQNIEWSLPGAPSLMSGTQSLFLWESLVQQTGDEPLLLTAETAKIAREAWVIHKKWKIPLSELSAYGSHPYFITWCTNFEERSRTLQLEDEANILSLLLQFIDHLIPCLPSRIQFVGFDDIPPQLEYFIQLLRERDVQAEFHQSQGETAGISLCSALTREEEFYQACAYSEQRLNINPQATFAIVLPDLESQRDKILKIAQSIFLGPPSPRYQEVATWPFTISGGQPLTSIPIIAHALLSLKIPITQHYNDWSVWLCSPFITGAGIESTQRLTLDLALRSELNQKVSLVKMTEVILEMAGLEQLKSLLFFFKSIDLTQTFSFSKWRQVVYEVLDALGWPGECILDSASHQAISHFYAAIDGLCELDGIASRVHYHEYLQQLFKAVTAVSFSPESAPQARCHILGGLEAGGLYFDHIWFCGLSDDIWPKEPNSNPFIPFVLARHYNIPRSSSVRELHFAKNMMQRFSFSCQTLVLSYPKTQRGLSTYPSPLLAPYGAVQHLENFNRFELQVFKNRFALETVIDSTSPPVSAEEILTLKGGAKILEAQVRCPFQAFARYRLNANPLPLPKDRIDQKTRGLLLHQVLENLWRELETQATLLKKTVTELDTLIGCVIKRALDSFAYEDSEMFSPVWCHIEFKRLVSLITRWVEIERQRPAFRVLEIEKTLLLTVQGLPIKLRLDRVDQLDSGECIIIDYKSGEASPKDWFGETPLAPQLPLYATVYEAYGLAFAKLHQKECRLEGVAADDHFHPLTAIAELKEADASTWEEQKNNWKNTFNQLAKAFLEGDARVSPLSPEKACRYCDLKSLCRIHEREALT